MPIPGVLGQPGRVSLVARADAGSVPGRGGNSPTRGKLWPGEKFGLVDVSATCPAADRGGTRPTPGGPRRTAGGWNRTANVCRIRTGETPTAHGHTFGRRDIPEGAHWSVMLRKPDTV